MDLLMFQSLRGICVIGVRIRKRSKRRCIHEYPFQSLRGICFYFANDIRIKIMLTQKRTDLKHPYKGVG